MGFKNGNALKKGANMPLDKMSEHEAKRKFDLDNFYLNKKKGLYFR